MFLFRVGVCALYGQQYGVCKGEVDQCSKPLVQLWRCVAKHKRVSARKPPGAEFNSFGVGPKFIHICSLNNYSKISIVDFLSLLQTEWIFGSRVNSEGWEPMKLRHKGKSVMIVKIAQARVMMVRYHSDHEAGVVETSLTQRAGDRLELLLSASL